METCRLPVAGQDRAHDPVAAISPVAVRDLARGRAVATLPLDLAALVPGVETWPVAERGLVGVRRQATWGTFLICRGAAEADRIVPAREPSPVEPRRLLRVVPRPISCITARRHNPVSRALDQVRVLVPAILPPTSHDLVRAAVEFNDPRRYPDKMEVEYSD
jgi:hypothetical protein